MANEARVFAEGPDNCLVRSVTVAASVAIPIGSLLVGTANRTGGLHTAGSLLCPLGFVTSSKASTDADYASATQVGVQRTGVVEAIADGYIEMGQVVFSGATTANRVQASFNGMLSLYANANLVIGRAITSAANGTAVKIALTLG